MRAGKARAGEYRYGFKQAQTFETDWRKPKPLTLWQRLMRWLNTP